MDKLTKIIPTTNKAGITGDYKTTQRITGIIAAGGIIFTSIDVLLYPVSQNRTSIVWLILVSLAFFTLIFYLTPPIYMKKGLAFVPDIVFSSGFLILMLSLGGNRGEAVIILLILLITIGAFTEPNWQFILSVFETLMAIILFYSITIGNGQTMSFTSILFQIIGIIVLITILRTLAKETISLRSEQKHLAESAHQLENQRNEILTLINNLSDGLVSVDRNQKINIANTAAVSMLVGNVDSKGIAGKVLNDIMPVSSNEARISLAGEVLESGKQTSYEDLKLVTPRGMFRISANTSPIFDEDGHQLGAIVSFRDVTAEKSLDEQRAEFNAVASHELRTPLTIIEGFTYNLLSDKRLEYDGKTKEYISQIDKAVNSLIKLTNDILTVTKSSNNQIDAVFEKVDIKKTIKDAVENLKPKAKAKKLELNLNLPKDLPIVLTDEGKFKEVMLNLVENAIKFTDKGSITIGASENEKGIVLVKVTDTGEGVKEADQKRIFNRFYRVNDFRTQKAGGTGLGLYISRTFITALGGRIGVNSEIGKGSTFWFTIPVAIKKEAKKEKTEEQLEDFIKGI
jgi:two-component system phosphate regulon sensor histidine kinase PhoR